MNMSSSVVTRQDIIGGLTFFRTPIEDIYVDPETHEEYVHRIIVPF